MTEQSPITFDAIHTRKKQENLARMMTETAAAVLQISNDQPRSDHCPICQGRELHHFTDKYGFRLDRCCHCHHLFCNPMPSKAQLHYYYNSPMKAFENEFFIESFENRVPIFSRRITIIQHYLSAGRLLDVGSAIGIFLTALERSGAPFEVHCCDPSDDACQYLRRHHPQVQLHQAMVEELQLDSQFDGITMWDTLEHVQNPHEVASAIGRLLRPGGYWFFSTPNTTSFEWTVAGTDHVQILPPGHINLFNLESVRVLLGSAGLSLIDYHTPNGSLDVSYVRKLLAAGDAGHHANAGRFIAERIQEDKFAAELARLLVETRQAGNILVIAQRHGESAHV